MPKQVPCSCATPGLEQAITYGGTYRHLDSLSSALLALHPSRYFTYRIQYFIETVFALRKRIDDVNSC